MSSFVEPSTTDPSIDETDAYDALLASQHAQLLKTGMSPSSLSLYLKKKAASESLGLQLQLYKSNAWKRDTTVTRLGVILTSAAALENLHRRTEAIYLLENQRFLGEDIDSDSEAEDLPPLHPRILLALSKLYFKNDQGPKALTYTSQIINSHSSPSPPDINILADAYYLSGWICIHLDSHTRAYNFWKEGSSRIPTSECLKKQKRKRDMWDYKLTDSDRDEVIRLKLFNGKRITYDRSKDFEAYKVCDEKLEKGCPALSIFKSSTQNNELVFTTKQPIITPYECSNILQILSSHITTTLFGTWSTVRSSSVPTTDVAVEDIPQLRNGLRVLMEERLWPILNVTFPFLVDSTTLTSESESRLRLHDAFIVRYSSEDGSLSLPEHSDTSAISFTVSLGGEYEGGERGSTTLRR